MSVLDPDLLKTFLAFVDGGSLARAAQIVNRSPSAVTAQMQRLEEKIGEPLLSPAGRGRALTPTGADLVVHARRIMAANRDAWLSLKGTRAQGRVGIGATQDFGEIGLPTLIAAFAQSHPRVRLELRIGRSAEIASAFEAGSIDVAIAMRTAGATDEVGVICERMEWLCAKEGLVAAPDEVPLALLDAPCGFRSAALLALEAAPRAYRITATSSSLAGLQAAVRGRIAVTVRTARWAQNGICVAPVTMQLPPLKDAEFSVRLRSDALGPATDFAELVTGNLMPVAG